MYVLNAFSLNMVKGAGRLEVIPITVEEASSIVRDAKADLQWAIGHEDTSLLVSLVLGINPQHAQRINVSLDDKKALVAQYKGPRLPEGTTKLPEGASIEFCLIKWNSH